MGSYDKINAQKEKYQKIIDDLNEKLNKANEQIHNLKEELSQIKYERFQDKRGVGEVDKLKKQVAILEKEVEKYKTTSFKNESYEVFSKERQELIKNIKNLSSKHQHISDIFHKFQTGTNQILSVAKIAKKRTLTIRDCYTHTFRDTLICLLEKTMQVLSGKMTRNLNSILYDCLNKKIEINDEFLKEIPQLKDKNTYRRLQYLVYLENVAFHGYVADTKMHKNEPVIESEIETEQFLKLSKKDQLDTFFTLLQILYTAFTSNSSEYILTQISGCWKYKID